jgi:hypothetical protein
MYEKRTAQAPAMLTFLGVVMLLVAIDTGARGAWVAGAISTLLGIFGLIDWIVSGMWRD